MSPPPLHPEQTLLVWGNLAGTKGSGGTRGEGGGRCPERAVGVDRGGVVGKPCQGTTLPMRSARDRRPSCVPQALCLTSLGPHTGLLLCVLSSSLCTNEETEVQSCVLHEVAEPRMDLPAKLLLCDTLLTTCSTRVQKLQPTWGTCNTASFKHCPLATCRCLVNFLYADLKITLFLPPLFRQQGPETVRCIVRKPSHFQPFICVLWNLPNAV